MKGFYNFLKFVAALAAIAAAVYVAITYGDKIVAWVKDKLGLCCCNCDCECACECCCEEAPAEAPAAEEADFEG